VWTPADWVAVIPVGHLRKAVRSGRIRRRRCRIRLGRREFHPALSRLASVSVSRARCRPAVVLVWVLAVEVVPAWVPVVAPVSVDRVPAWVSVVVRVSVDSARVPVPVLRVLVRRVRVAAPVPVWVLVRDSVVRARRIRSMTGRAGWKSRTTSGLTVCPGRRRPSSVSD
jgi:hypothetical protein